MLARVTTFAIDGLDPRRVTVEVDLRAGLPAFTIVGLGDRAVRESRERVAAAISNSGFEFPAAGHRQPRARLPAQERARASTWRSPARVLAASGQVTAPERSTASAVFGELALGGEVRPVRGALAVAEGARRGGPGRSGGRGPQRP